MPVKARVEKTLGFWLRPILVIWRVILVLTEKKKSFNGQGEDENMQHLRKRIFSGLIWHTFAPDTSKIWKYRAQTKQNTTSVHKTTKKKKSRRLLWIWCRNSINVVPENWALMFSCAFCNSLQRLSFESKIVWGMFILMATSWGVGEEENSKHRHKYACH